MVDRETLNTLGKGHVLAKGDHPHEQKADPQKYFSVVPSCSSGNEMLLVF